MNVSERGIRRVLGDPSRKSIPQMVWEIARLWREHGHRPSHYVHSFLYRKGAGNITGYLSDRECSVLWRRFRDSASSPIMDNKLLFHRFFDGVTGITLPRFLGYTLGGEVVYRWDGSRLRLRKKEDLELVAQGFLSDVGDDSVGGSVFAKPMMGKRGEGAFKLFDVSLVATLWEAIHNADYIFQQTERQHPAFAALMPDVLNTLRITTLNKGDGPAVASVWLKIGRTGNIADNVSGMIIAGVDLKSGMLSRVAKTKFEAGGDTYTHHPDTNYELGSFRVPYFQEALDMAYKAASHIDCPVVGWDIGIGIEGPVLLEGNVGSHYPSDEVAHGIGYIDNPVLGPYLRGLITTQGGRKLYGNP